MPRDLTTWRHFAVLGLLYSALPFTLLAWGQQHIASALAAVLNATTPLFAALATAAILGERLRAPQLVGLAIGFGGVAIAAGLGGDDVAGSSPGGAMAAVAASCCYGYSFAYARQHLNTTPPLVAATGQLVAATLLLAPLAIGTTIADGIDLEPHRVLAISLLGMIGTGFAYVLNYQSIAAVGATRASIVTYLVPVVAVAVGVTFLDEPFRLGLVLGGGLTVFGVALLHDRIRRFRIVPVAT